MHLDGDAFFASVHAALDPKLRGVPVVTGHDRGIVSSMSYEAKKLGITRATPIYQVKKLYPQVRIVSSDYDAYAIYSERMKNIISRYIPHVEKYSIDECFADFSYLPKQNLVDFQTILHSIQNDIERELAISVSLGLAPTKTLAKLASKLEKPHGVVVIEEKGIVSSTSMLPIEMVWGIGFRTARILTRVGIKTIGDFISQKRDWVLKHFSKNILEIWEELQGIRRHSVVSHVGDHQKSISHTRSFDTKKATKNFVYGEIITHLDQVFAKLRSQNLKTRHASLFLKTKELQYHTEHIDFGVMVDAPTSVVVEAVTSVFNRLWNLQSTYKASGVTLYALVKNDNVQPSLFDNQKDNQQESSSLFVAIDTLRRKFGSNAVVIAAAKQSFAYGRSTPSHILKKGMRRLPIIWLGYAR